MCVSVSRGPTILVPPVRPFVLLNQSLCLSPHILAHFADLPTSPVRFLLLLVTGKNSNSFAQPRHATFFTLFPHAIITPHPLLLTALSSTKMARLAP